MINTYQLDSVLDLEWLREVPSDWSVRRIKRIMSRVDYGISESTRQEGRFSVLKMGHLQGGEIKFSNLDFVDDVSEDLLLENGDLLYNRTNSSDEVGKAAIFRGSKRDQVTYASYLVRLRADHHANPRFLNYLLNSEGFLTYARKLAIPSVQQSNLNSTRYCGIMIPLPPRAEQDRIAEYLDTSCAALDVAVTAKRSQLQTLDALRKSNLHQAFAELNRWPVERVKDITSKIGSGVTPEGGAAGYLDVGIPLLRSQNVHFDGLRLDDVAHISEETHADMSNSQLRPKDVLLNITGASIGRCTFVPEDFGEGNVNQHVCIVRPGPKVDYRFLAGFLSSPAGQDQVFSMFTGASRQGLSHKELGLIRIPLPPLEIQVNVITTIERNYNKHQNVRQCIESQIDTLIAYRKSLIHECVTGKRRITERELSQEQVHA